MGGSMGSINQHILNEFKTYRGRTLYTSGVFLQKWYIDEEGEMRHRKIGNESI